MKRFSVLAGRLLLVSLAGALTAHAQPVDEAALRKFTADFCLACHQGKQATGMLDLAAAPLDLHTPAAQRTWRAVVERVSAGEMPPADKPQPPPARTAAFLAALRTPLAAASAAQGRTVFRRLNRAEYENTLRALLQIQVDLKETLPLDTAQDGFDNHGEALHTSSFLLERYLEAADRALDLAIASTPQPALVKKRLLLADERYVKTTTEPVFRREGEGLGLFSSSAWNAITIGQFYPPERGRYRIRISGKAIQTDKPIALRIDAGPMLMGQKNHLVDYFEFPPGETTVREFTEFFEARHSLRILPYLPGTAFTLKAAGGAEKYEGPGLAIDWIEVEGPLHEFWPPASHRAIFGDLPQKSFRAPGNRPTMEVVSEQPQADAERILRQFASRAYRRPATPAEVALLMGLYEAKTAAGRSFEQAVRVGLKAVLTSPPFLFRVERPGPLDDHALATRLAYFLWSAPPDDELLSLAAAGKLRAPGELRRQTERLLSDPRARALTENFLGQWLKLRDIDFTSPDPRLYPEFDELLKTAMLRETELFFEEVLRRDLSLTSFIASDFTFLNERLAKHYGVEGVEGQQLRRVQLPAGSPRGGVLTMASVLKVTANGTSTSPVMRGAFVLDRLLGAPPAPPPEGVSAIEPDIRGAVTIREQLAKHREVESCGACHRQIDPPGFALESFDVIGGYRDFYRSLGRGSPVMVDGKRAPYARGLPVDPSDLLADGRRFADIREFKALLLADPDALARGLARHLVTYATGAAPRSEDQAELAAVIARVKAHNYGFRSLLHELVASPLFQTK